MSRFFASIAVAVFAGTTCADSPPVADLVKQLGDPKFAVREAAQKELLKRGEGIVPELDRLTKGADAETADRIGKVRYELIGYKDDIRRLLADVHEGKDSSQVPVSAELRGLIAGHQPGAGNLLLDILAQPKHALHRRAVRTFVSTWDAATPDQIDAYVQQVVRLKTAHRPQFPAKVGAMISFEAQLREGWVGWPQPDPRGFTFKTRTTRYLDGKPYDKPFEYRYAFATVGWYRVGELAEGTHTIHAVLEYEFTQNGQKRKGEIRSKDSTFEVIAANSPDRLIAPASTKLSNSVRAVFRLQGVQSAPVDAVGIPRSGQPEAQPFPPQVSWETAPGIRAGLRCVEWSVVSPLTVDLCMDVEIHDVKSGKVYPADPLCVTGDATARGYLVPRDVQTFARGRDGLVSVKIVLKPSRALALTDVRMKHYYPDTITVDDLKTKVVLKIEPVARHER